MGESIRDEEIQHLLSEYVRWIQENMVVQDAGEWVEITTPFLDRHNDCIQIYAQPRDGGYVLTDDGYAVGDLESSGYCMDAPNNKALLCMVINGFGVELNEDALEVHATSQTFAQGLHALIQAMQSLPTSLFST